MSDPYAAWDENLHLASDEPDGYPDRRGRDVLPPRVVVDADGAYWRDFGSFYSMCPTSADNEPMKVVAVYEMFRRTKTVPPGSHCPECGGELALVERRSYGTVPERVPTECGYTLPVTFRMEPSAWPPRGWHLVPTRFPSP